MHEKEIHRLEFARRRSYEKKESTDFLTILSSLLDGTVSLLNWPPAGLGLDTPLTMLLMSNPMLGDASSQSLWGSTATLTTATSSRQRRHQHFRQRRGSSRKISAGPSLFSSSRCSGRLRMACPLGHEVLRDRPPLGWSTASVRPHFVSALHPRHSGRRTLSHSRRPIGYATPARSRRGGGWSRGRAVSVSPLGRNVW